MVDFYTEEGVKQDNWTSDSKGFKTADYEGLFSGLGDGIKMAATAVDNYYQGTIKEEAKVATDKLYNDYGNSSAVAVEGGIDSTATPKEIADGAKRLNLLKSAAVAGTLKGSSYWAQAELISRQLKMRYPGYWEQIDSTMGGILGRKPANALQAELEQERNKAVSEAEARSKAAEQERRDAEKAARSIGLSEVFVAKMQGKELPVDYINKLVADRQALEYQQQSTLRDYDIKKKRSEATEQDGIHSLRGELQHKMTTYLNDSKSPIAATVNDYNTLQDKVQAYRSSGQPVPPQLEQQIGAAAAGVEAQINNYANEMSLKYGQDLPYAKVKEEVALITDWGKRFVNGVKEGDRSATGSNIALLNSLKNYDDYNFLMGADNDIIRKDAIIARNMPGDGYAAFWAANLATNKVTGTSLASERLVAYQKAMANNSMFDGRPLKENAKRMQEQRVSAPQAYNGVVTTVLNATTSEHVTPPLKENAIEAVYGAPNLDFLSTSVSAKEQVPMFMKVTAPNHLKELKAQFDKGQISSESWDKVVNWTVTNAAELVRQQTTEINSINAVRKNSAVTYNPDTYLLKSVRGGPFTSSANTMAGRALVQVSEKWMQGDAENAVNRVNNVIRNYKALLELTGDDVKAGIPELLIKSGLDPKVLLGGSSIERQEPGMEQTVKAVEKYIGDLYNNMRNPELEGAQVMTPSEANKKSGKQPQDREKISKDLDEIFKNVPEEEQVSTAKKLLMLLLGMTETD